MTVDRNELAGDLERLGMTAIAPSVRPTARHPLSLDRVMRSVELTRDRAKERGDSKGAEAAQQVLNRYWGKS